MKLFEAIILRSRLNPLKTKLKPSFEIDWGVKFDKADFIKREKGEIGLFDLKTFVNEKRKEKVMSGMNNSAPGMSPMNDGLFQNPNPFSGGMNPFANPNPFAGNDVPNPFGGSGEVDVDDLLKKIDAKIAELEAEEQAEKEKNKTQEFDNKSSEEVIKEFESSLETLNIDDKDEVELLDLNNNKKDSKTFSDILNENKKDTPVKKEIVDNNPSITDDEYFDDFFQDE